MEPVGGDGDGGVSLIFANSKTNTIRLSKSLEDSRTVYWCFRLRNPFVSVDGSEIRNGISLSCECVNMRKDKLQQAL